MFSNEDVTIGSWMLAMNVHHEDNRAICDPRCTSTSIAVWDIPKCSGNTIFVTCPAVTMFLIITCPAVIRFLAFSKNYLDM